MGEFKVLINETNGEFHLILTAAETAGLGIADVLECEKTAGELLCRLLFIAAAAKNTAPAKTDFSAEVYMQKNGGCEIFFSPCRIRVRPKRRTLPPLRVFEFPDSEAMLSAVESLFAVCSDAGGGLYTENGRYRIVFDTVPKAEHTKLICNFGFPVTTPAAAGRTDEYWSPVCLCNAIGTVGAALSAVKNSGL